MNFVVVLILTVLLTVLTPSRTGYSLGYDVVDATLSDIQSSDYDTSVVIVPGASALGTLPSIKSEVEALIRVDPAAAVGVSVVPSGVANGGRFIYSATGPLDGDYEDIRPIREAAIKATQKAVSLGSKSILLIIGRNQRFDYSDLVAAEGALSALYIPKEVQEMQNKSQPIERIGVAILGDNGRSDEIAKIAKGLDKGRVLARDLQGGEPEQMTAPNMASHIAEVFRGSATVKTVVTTDQDVIKEKYPGVELVNRGCNHLDQYKARVVRLEYSRGTPNQTLLVVGKGVTFDSGGHDLKTKASMHIMRLDKSGAAAVAGLFMVLNELQPDDLKVVGMLPLVRNCIGSRAYLPSELFKTRSGKILRTFNTDCEGRLIMIDPMSELREQIAAPKIYAWCSTLNVVSD